MVNLSPCVNHMWQWNSWNFLAVYSVQFLHRQIEWIDPLYCLANIILYGPQIMAHNLCLRHFSQAVDGRIHSNERCKNFVSDGYCWFSDISKATFFCSAANITTCIYGMAWYLTGVILRYGVIFANEQKKYMNRGLEKI